MLNKTFSGREDGSRILVYGNKDLRVDVYVQEGGHSMKQSLREISFNFKNVEDVRDLIDVLNDICVRMAQVKEEDKSNGP